MGKDFLDALKELLASKKFITAVAGISVTLLAKIGLKADTETIASIVSIIALLLLGQASTDFGKAAKVAENDPKLKILETIINNNLSSTSKEKTDKA